MKTRLMWVTLGALTFALLGQFVYLKSDAHHAAGASSIGHAVWGKNAANFAEAQTMAQVMVLAEVVKSGPGPDMVVSQPGEPDGFDYIPTRQVVVKVSKVYKGKVTEGQLLTLAQTGGELQTPSQAKVGQRTVVLHDDPFYTVGEQYVLLLEARPHTPGEMMTISPDGRYLVQKDGTLKSMAPERATAKEIDGQTLASMEQMVLAPAKK